MSCHVLAILRTAPTSLANATRLVQAWQGRKSRRLVVGESYVQPVVSTAEITDIDKWNSKTLQYVGLFAQAGLIGSETQMLAYARNYHYVQADRLRHWAVLHKGAAIVLGVTLCAAYRAMYVMTEAQGRLTNMRKFSHSPLQHWAAGFANRPMRGVENGGYCLWLPTQGLILWVSRAPRDTHTYDRHTSAEDLLGKAWDAQVSVVVDLLERFLRTAVTPAWDATKHDRGTAWMKYNLLSAYQTDYACAMLFADNHLGVFWEPWSAGRHAWRFSTESHWTATPPVRVLEPAQWVTSLLRLAFRLVQTEMHCAAMTTSIQELADNGHSHPGLAEDTDVRYRDLADSAGPACTQTRAWLLSSQRYWEKLAGAGIRRPVPNRPLDELAGMDDCGAQPGF